MSRVRLAAAALLGATIASWPLAALAQGNGTSQDQHETEGRGAETESGVKGAQGAGDSVGPASSSGENKGASPVGSPDPLAGSTKGKY